MQTSVCTTLTVWFIHFANRVFIVFVSICLLGSIKEHLVFSSLNRFHCYCYRRVCAFIHSSNRWLYCVTQWSTIHSSSVLQSNANALGNLTVASGGSCGPCVKASIQTDALRQCGGASEGVFKLAPHDFLKILSKSKPLNYHLLLAFAQ